MTNKQAFIKVVEDQIKFDSSEVGVAAAEYFEKFKEMKDRSKSDITEKGKEILGGLANFTEPVLAKDLAESLNISSRSVSGSMRKLVTDGYANKVTNDEGTNKYEITAEGRTKL